MHSAAEVGWIRFGTDDDGWPGDYGLLPREVILRIGFHCETGALDAGDNPYNLAHARLENAIADPETDALAHGGFARKVFAREGLIDDNDTRGVYIIRGQKLTAGEQADAHRAEEIRRRNTHVLHRLRAG